MKKVLLIAAFVMSGVAIKAQSEGCNNRPNENNGHCRTSTHNGTVDYFCSDLEGDDSKDCVK
jgi:hypothetical protein